MDDERRQHALASRAEIRSGALRGQALLERIVAVPSADRDPWVDELLGIDDSPPDVPDLPRGAVPYLPSGVEEILAVVREVPIRPSDEVVDLGSGLGRVVLLTHLLSGARALGVEIQSPLVELSRARSEALGLVDVSFVQANAAELELDGSVFFMYAPFNGPMLARVLERIERVAQRRAIVVCTIDVVLPDLAWLTPRRTPQGSLTLYDSRAPIRSA